MVLRVLDKTGVMVRYRAMLYKAAVQTVIFMGVRVGRSRGK